MRSGLVEIPGELISFVADLELQTNTHNFRNVEPLIHPNAIYRFSDGGLLIGREAIGQAFMRTWQKIRDEKYSISDVMWPEVGEQTAMYDYTFHWEGLVGGELQRNRGLGRNVLVREQAVWQVGYEKLMKYPSKLV